VKIDWAFKAASLSDELSRKKSNNDKLQQMLKS
jgi:hypothetical protein